MDPQPCYEYFVPSLHDERRGQRFGLLSGACVRRVGNEIGGGGRYRRVVTRVCEGLACRPLRWRWQVPAVASPKPPAVPCSLGVSITGGVRDLVLPWSVDAPTATVVVCRDGGSCGFWWTTLLGLYWERSTSGAHRSVPAIPTVGKKSPRFT